MIEKLTKNKKYMWLSVAIMIVLVVGTVVALSMSDEEDDIVEEVTAKGPIFLELELDYKETLYTIIYEDEEYIIYTEEVTPVIDTTEIGESEHKLTIDEQEIILKVQIIDNREITLNNLDEIVVDAETMTQEELEEELMKQLLPQAVAEEVDDALYVGFAYPDEFNLDIEGVYEVTIEAKFENNPGNKRTEKVTVRVTIPEEEQVEVAATEEPTEEIEVAYETEQSNTDSVNTQESSLVDHSASNAPSSEEVPESNPDPEPESERLFGPQPIQPTADVPVGIPGGATFVREESDQTTHTFYYTSSLSNDGITEKVLVSYDIGDVMISGMYNSGSSFLASYNREGLRFWWEMPDMSHEEMDALRDLGGLFLSAYGF